MWLPIVFVNLMVLVCVTSFDYCTIGPSNTMCIHKPNEMGSACGQILSPLLSESDKMAILNEHNKLRNAVAQGLETRGAPGPQPKATNMQQLVWDDELAQMAQTHANQCVFQHDANRNVARWNPWVGQNIAIEYSSIPFTSLDHLVTQLVRMWYDEVASFNSTGVGSYAFAEETGHYTQLVWARTSSLGCGLMNYRTNWWNNVFLVCNYGQGGNMITAPVYTTGDTAASNCPSGTKPSATYPGLCI